MQFDGNIRIGFTFLLGGGGPSTFMKRLRSSIAKQKIAKISSIINPLTDINIFSNKSRDIYCKPYVLRVDGIYFDIRQTCGSNEEKNKAIFSGIDRAAGVIFQSAFDLALISKFHRRPEQSFEIIHNGVDIDLFSSFGPNRRKELNIDADDIVFVTAAKWRTHKRLQDTVNVFCEYDTNSNKACHLIILGKSIECDDHNHPRIHKIGYVEPDKLPEWYRAGNIFLFFSWLDHCPNTVIEAIACGLPVICTNQGGTRELVEITKGGIVVEADGEFDFEPVDLYNPPQPDYNKMLAAINAMEVNYDSYVQRIDRTMINIDNVARKYVGFVQKVVRYIAC